MAFMHMIDFCLMEILKVELLALPSSSFFFLSSSFLLAFTLPSFLFGGVLAFGWVWRVFGRETMREKMRDLFLALDIFLSLSFFALAENGFVGGGNNALFYFLLVCLASFFNHALTTHQILSCCFAKTMCKIVVFLSSFAKSQ